MTILGYAMVVSLVLIMSGAATYPLWKKDVDAINAEAEAQSSEQ